MITKKEFDELTSSQQKKYVKEFVNENREAKVSGFQIASALNALGASNYVSATGERSWTPNDVSKFHIESGGKKLRTRRNGRKASRAKASTSKVKVQKPSSERLSAITEMLNSNMSEAAKEYFLDVR